MVRLIAQYLEDEPALAELTPLSAAERLRAALAMAPIADVALGWGLPPAIVDAVREVAMAAGSRLHAWQLLLAGSCGFAPPEAWRVIGLDGRPVPAFRGMSEFTFFCPNHPAARAAALVAIATLAADDRYDGVMLDRMRFPSPLADPERMLGCFCPHCRAAAAGVGLDLDDVTAATARLAATPAGARRLMATLLGRDERSEPDSAVVAAFLSFRQTRVTALIADAARVARAAGKGIALDCFSPALARAVGQDLPALEPLADDVKLMTYGGTFAPAGLPFELHGLAAWLTRRGGMEESEALGAVTEASGLPLPDSLEVLRREGLPPTSLAIEIERARQGGLATVTAGIDLVQLDGVTCEGWDDRRVETALRAIRDAEVDALVLSWDLWHVARDRLRLVADLFAS